MKNNPAKELRNEDAFLMQEHGEIWQFVRKITDERNSWLKFYWTIIAASMGGLGYLYLKLPRPLLFWMISTLILFLLLTVSIIVLMALFGLRKRSVEYRNHLNIIRAWFLSRCSLVQEGDASNQSSKNFEEFLKTKRSPETDPKKKLRWKYLSEKPNQMVATCGIEMSVLYLFTIFPSAVAGAFVFSIVHLSIFSEAFLEYRLRISIGASFAFFFISVCWVYLCGHSIDKKEVKG